MIEAWGFFRSRAEKLKDEAISVGIRIAEYADEVAPQLLARARHAFGEDAVGGDPATTCLTLCCTLIVMVERGKSTELPSGDCQTFMDAVRFTIAMAVADSATSGDRGENGAAFLEMARQTSAELASTTEPRALIMECSAGLAEVVLGERATSDLRTSLIPLCAKAIGQGVETAQSRA